MIRLEVEPYCEGCLIFEPAELKRYTIKAAEELYYDQSYISQLKHATTEGS